MDPLQRYAHPPYEQGYYPAEVPYPDVARDASDACVKGVGSYYGYPTATPGAFPSPAALPGPGPGNNPYMVGYGTLNKPGLDRRPLHDPYGTLRSTRYDIQVSWPTKANFQSLSITSDLKASFRLTNVEFSKVMKLLHEIAFLLHG